MAGCRVPHLRDGFIVAKVGIRAKREPPYLNQPKPLGCPILCSLIAKGGNVVSPASCCFN
jgi:hypothetical protein